MTKIFFTLFTVLIFSSVSAVCCYGAETRQEKLKTEITGNRMEIKDAGSKTIFKGNAKIVRGSSTITADKMTYYKDKDDVDAQGNVNFSVKNEDGSLIKAKSQNALYNTKNYSGKLWNGNPVINYTMANSTETIRLYADDINLGKNFETAKADGNVKIYSSSGTVFSDNALLNKTDNSLIMTKAQNKPRVNFVQEGKNADFNADKISLFYDKKIVIMNGNVEGKIIIDSLEENK